MRRILSSGLLICMALSSLQVFAQLGSTTSLVGTTTDTSGAIVADAKITAVNIATHNTYETVTNGHGDYVFPFVQIGTYQITAVLSGFQTTNRAGIIVESNQTVRVDFVLKVGQASQTVTVTGATPPIATDDPSLSQIINTQQAADLPLNGRDPLKLAITTPGVILGLKANIPSAPGEDFIGAGGREVQNDVSLDGVSIMNNLITNVNFRPSLEAIQEAQIQTGTFPAQYGGYLGVHINLVTKSGSNSLHGSLFEYVRNSAFDARGFFETPGTPKIPFHRNQFGAQLGGPIVIPKLYHGKDKTFFMVSYEGLRQLQSTATLASVLTAKMRTGDFSEISTPIKDPLLPGDPVIPGNVIPAANISPQALKLLQFLPAPNRGGLVNNFNTPVAANDNWDQTVDRIDENLNERTRFFFRYGYFSDSPFYGATNPYNATPGPNTDNNFVIGYTQTITPNMVNDFRFGRQEINVSTLNVFYGNAALQAQTANLGIPGFQPTSSNPGIPSIGITGYTSIASGIPTLLTDRTWQANDTFSYTYKAHTIVAGFDLSQFHIDRTAVNLPIGSFTFTGQLSGSAPADYMLGIPLSSTTPEPAVAGIFSQWRNGFFVQDKWEASKKLTMNLGLRWEVPTAVKTVNGNATLLNATDTALIPANPPVPGFVLVNGTWTAVAPRVGFAYRATDHWVVRGGAGIYYNPNHLNDFTLLDTNPPFSPSFNYQNTNFSAPTVTFNNPSPSSTLAPAPPSNVVTVSQHLKVERMNQWSLSVERSLWPNAGLDVQYLGKFSYFLDASFYNNTPTPGPGAIQARRPNQLWGTIRTMNNNEIAHYDALNVVLTQRLNHGATILASYTWSHDLDEGPDSNSTQPMNPYNVALDYASSNWDIRHRFVADYSYILPFFHGSSNAFMRYALGGWQINGITTLQTGMPVNVVLSGDVANNGITGVQRPNVVGKPSADCNASHLVNCITSAAFATPAAYTFGNASRNIVTGPGLVDFDFSVFKEFPITERARLQFRSEFFNLFNQPSFAQPNSTFATAAFGTLSATSNNNREIQFAGKFLF
jgi:hypothetical protein